MNPTDSAQNNNSTTSHRVYARLLCAFAESASGCPAAGWRLCGRQYSRGDDALVEPHHGIGTQRRLVFRRFNHTTRQ